jgi:hypothetical protein
MDWLLFSHEVSDALFLGRENMKTHVSASTAIAALIGAAVITPAPAQAGAVAGALIGAVGKLGPQAYETIQEYNTTNNRLRSPSDALIFWEDNNCDANKKSNLVGSLPLDYKRNVAAKDTPWFRNDEARSVLIWNDDKVEYPPIAGSIITLWDDPDKSKDNRMKGRDDFTVIRILKDIPKGHAICIGSFEDNFEDVGGYIKMTHHHKNGLDGKISFATSAPGPKAAKYAKGDSADALPDALVFYEGNDCKQNVVARYSGWSDVSVNCKKSDHCKNDEARSLLIYDFVKNGTNVKVYDHPEAKTNDDWTEIKIGKPAFMGAYCVGTFERSRDEKGVNVNFHKDNGLDGKVSHIKVNR